jgi:LysM repeat protein
MALTALAIAAISFITFAIAHPSESSADMVSLFSSAFKNNDLKEAEELETTNKNAQNMVLLAAPLNSDQTTQHATAERSLIEGKALTNENSSVTGVAGASDIPNVNSDRITLYTVHTGDTIELIAKMFGVNANTIRWANDIKKGTPLRKDQVLVIMPISSIKHIVKKGDTLPSIAKLYKLEVFEIADFNSLDSNASLTVGDELIIPDIEGTLADEADKKLTEAEKKKSDSKKRIIDGTNIKVDTSGYFMRPLVGGIKTQGIHGRNGVDIASSFGTPILAAASGRVIVSQAGGWGGGYGTYIVIQHSNGTQTLYGHLSTNLVSVGQMVSKGEMIGKMGSTGHSTGAHLHFEVRGGRNPF